MVGTVILNGVEYGAGEIIGAKTFGAFVDTSHVIKASTTFLDHTSYTATEDCFVRVYVVTGRGSVFCTIDGENVWNPYWDNVMGQSALLPLRKGQVLEITNTHQTYESNYIVYGVIGGTNPIFAPAIYSDTEREVGCWTDGKPIYQKTVHINALPDSTQIGQYIDYPHSISDIETICGFEGLLHFSNGNALGPIRVGFNTVGFNYQVSIDSYCTTSAVRIEVGQDRSNVSADYTIWYTKTTDTPGSGKWNVDGVPAVHYSTSERVIGTWIDGKPLYEKTIEFPITSTLGSGFNTIEAMPNIIPIDMKGHLLNLNDGRVYPLNYSNSTATSSLLYYQGNITLNIQNDSWGTTYKLWVTVQYIKTTD